MGIMFRTLLFVIVICPTSFAFENTKSLYNACSSIDALEKKNELSLSNQIVINNFTTCQAYIMGVFDGYSMYSALQELGVKVCIPKDGINKDKTTLDYMNYVEKKSKENPAFLETAARIGLIGFVRDKYGYGCDNE